eukprot:3654780-Rhodomonas_salina.1
MHEEIGQGGATINWPGHCNTGAQTADKRDQTGATLHQGTADYDRVRKPAIRQGPGDKERVHAGRKQGGGQSSQSESDKAGVQRRETISDPGRLE